MDYIGKYNMYHHTGVDFIHNDIKIAEKCNTRQKHSTFLHGSESHNLVYISWNGLNQSNWHKSVGMA